MTSDEFVCHMKQKCHKPIRHVRLTDRKQKLLPDGATALHGQDVVTDPECRQSRYPRDRLIRKQTNLHAGWPLR